MNQTYTIKNFRVFDEQGATFEMAPVTILTGCNSSGKSSVTKSLMLLHPLMSQYKQDIQSGTFGTFSGPGFSSHLLDFTRENHKLGTLEKVVNWNSTNNEFSVEYSVYSYALMNTVTVTLVFGKDEDAHNTQTLRARLQKVRMMCDEKLLYSYEYKGVHKDKPYRAGSLNEHAYINIGGWKKELMEGVQWLEIGYAFNQISKDIEAEQAGFGYATHFDYSDLESAKAFFEEQYMNYIWYRYETLKALLPEQMSGFCKRFDLKNLIHNENGSGIDWPKTEYKYDLPNNHVFSLGKLMDELNEVSKDKIVDFAESRFMDEKVVREELLNGANYRQWIHDMFEEYASSDFDCFADFYSHYEDINIRNEGIYFGTRGGRARSIGQERIMDLLGSGTANPVAEAGIQYSWLSKQWNNLSDCQKFECMFYCLQGFGGYEDLSCCGGPGISVPNLDVLRDFATIVCAEVIANCDLLTEVDFVEIDRSNAQRMYSFKEQGTSFNSILDNYYNLCQTVFYPGRTGANSRIYEKGDFINKWLRELTGFTGFKIKQAPEGIGYYVMLQTKSSKNKYKWISLADVGYGTTPLISMLMRIEIMICNYLNKHERVTICIEEPESNLHPALQSRLAEVFADAAEHYPINFIIETHSEYLVRKSQVIVAAKEYKNQEELDQKCPFKIYYIPRQEEGVPYDMGYQLNGKFKNKFGKGFLDVADSLMLELL